MNKTNNFQPYISTNKKCPEITLRATIIGVLLGVIFGIGNVYIGLRVGQTMKKSD